MDRSQRIVRVSASASKPAASPRCPVAKAVFRRVDGEKQMDFDLPLTFDLTSLSLVY